MIPRSVGEEWGEQGKCGSSFLVVLVDLWRVRGKGLQVAAFHTMFNHNAAASAPAEGTSLVMQQRHADGFPNR